MNNYPKDASIATKADIEGLRADLFKSHSDLTSKLAGIVFAGMGFVIAVLKLTP